MGKRTPALAGSAAKGSTDKPSTDKSASAFEFYQSGNYRSMQLDLERKAKGGDREAQYNWGMMHYKGHGVPRNLQLAQQWFDKSARQEYAPAQYILGAMADTGYETDSGKVEKNEALALEYFNKAAAQEYVPALYALGLKYETGSGKIRKDEAEAIKCFYKAAWVVRRLDRVETKYCIEAQYRLGTMYEEGRGTEKNEQEAYFCFLKAAEKGSHKEAQYRLAMMLEEGRGTERNLQLAINWYTKAATPTSMGGQEQPGHKGAHYRLGLVYTIYPGFENYPLALEKFLLAAEQDHADAQYSVAMLYQQGEGGVEKNEEQAVTWLIKAANNGRKEAQYSLGRRYEEGRGVEKEEKRAIKWMTKAAEQGHTEAQYYLGVKYQEGRGVEKDELKALDWLSAAAKEEKKGGKILKEGYKPAQQYLSALTEKMTHPHNTYPEIKKLIHVTQKVLGSRYEADIPKMFYTLWQEGIPESELKDETFYYYTYEMCASPQAIPENREPGKVYLYIEGDCLHYQLLHFGSIETEFKVYSGIVETSLHLDKLKEVTFVQTVPTGSIRQIFPIYSDKRTEGIYSVTTDQGERKVGFIHIDPKEDEEAIKQKLLRELEEKGYCLKKEIHIESLKSDLDNHFTQNQDVEPLYEARIGLIKKQYEEIRVFEKGFQAFLKNLIDILNDDKFRAIFAGDENFKHLRKDILLVASTLKLDQAIICQQLSEDVQKASQVIDALKNAFQTTIHHKNYYDMVGLMESLKKLWKDKEEMQEAIKKFSQGIPAFVTSGNSFLDVPTIFSAQYMTRRRLLLNDLVTKFFRKRHVKVYELELVFYIVNRLAATANIAQMMSSADLSTVGSKNTQTMVYIQTGLTEENNRLKIWGFDLVKSIWNILLLDIQQYDSLVIYRALLNEKQKIQNALSNLSKAAKKYGQYLQSDIDQRIDIVAERIKNTCALNAIIALIIEAEELVGIMTSKLINPSALDLSDQISSPKIGEHKSPLVSPVTSPVSSKRESLLNSTRRLRPSNDVPGPLFKSEQSTPQSPPSFNLPAPGRPTSPLNLSSHARPMSPSNVPAQGRPLSSLNNQPVSQSQPLNSSNNQPVSQTRPCNAPAPVSPQTNNRRQSGTLRLRAPTQGADSAPKPTSTLFSSERVDHEMPPHTPLSPHRSEYQDPPTPLSPERTERRDLPSMFSPGKSQHRDPQTPLSPERTEHRDLPNSFIPGKVDRGAPSSTVLLGKSQRRDTSKSEHQDLSTTFSPGKGKETVDPPFSPDKSERLPPSMYDIGNLQYPDLPNALFSSVKAPLSDPTDKVKEKSLGSRLADSARISPGTVRRGESSDTPPKRSHTPRRRSLKPNFFSNGNEGRAALTNSARIEPSNPKIGLNNSDQLELDPKNLSSSGKFNLRK